MNVQDIVKLIKKYHHKSSLIVDRQPKHHNIMMDQGMKILCEDLLNKIDPGWSLHEKQKGAAPEDFQNGLRVTITAIDITVPSFLISQLYESLGCTEDEECCLSENGIVALKLEDEGFDSFIDDEGDLQINNFTMEDIDLMEDPVVLALSGGTALPGSTITCHDDENNQYRLTYLSPAGATIYKGKILFPGDEANRIF